MTKSIMRTLLVMCLMLTVGATACTPAEPETVELSFTGLGPETHMSTPLFRDLFDTFETETGGRVKVTEWHWRDELGKAEDQYALVRDGVADIGFCYGSYTPGVFPFLEVGTLPLAAQNTVHTTQAMLELWDDGWFDEQLAEVAPICMWANSPYQFLLRGKKPMTVEELAGLKVRSAGGYFTVALERLNCVPVQVTSGEWYDSLQKGVMDAIAHTYTTFQTYKVDEIADYVLEMGFSTAASSFVALNKDAWEKLTPSEQALLVELGKETSVNMTRKYYEQDEVSKADMISKGIEVYQLSPEDMAAVKQTVAPVWEEAIAEWESQGLPGREMVEAFVAELTALGENPPYGA